MKKIEQTKSIEELNNLENELVKSYWLLYTTNHFLQDIIKQREILYNNC